MAKVLERAEAALQAAEEANRKANSEAGYAYNAKQSAEDHARDLSASRECWGGFNLADHDQEKHRGSSPSDRCGEGISGTRRAGCRRG